MDMAVDCKPGEAFNQVGLHMLGILSLIVLYYLLYYVQFIADLSCHVYILLIEHS